MSKVNLSNKAAGYSTMGVGAALAVVSVVYGSQAYGDASNYGKEKSTIEQRIEGIKQERAGVGNELEKCLASPENNCACWIFVKWGSRNDFYFYGVYGKRYG